MNSFFKKNKMKTDKNSISPDEKEGNDEAMEAISGEQEPIQEATNPVELIKAELAVANDKYLRLYSDFENYKKRYQKERIDLIKTAGSDIITSLLPVLDDFERAVNSMEKNTDLNALKEGVLLIQNKLKTILLQRGLTAIDSLNKEFDTDLHEAVTSIPVDDSKKGLVVDELEKGYLLNEKVLRHAKVVVGN
jgi:molecular chaperone GrpE